MPQRTVLLQETRVGMPAKIGMDGERPLYSSIHRRRTDQVQLYLTATGLAHDVVTDTRAKVGGGQIHGGHTKAVYVYPWQAHLPRWLEVLGRAGMGNRSFGENLRVAGTTEETARIGDVWEWGDALLMVTGPRLPCATLDRYYGRPMIGPMARNGLCGWYMSVSRPGLVPTMGRIRLVERQDQAPSVAEVFRTRMPLQQPR